MRLAMGALGSNKAISMFLAFHRTNVKVLAYLCRLEVVSHYRTSYVPLLTLSVCALIRI